MNTTKHIIGLSLIISLLGCYSTPEQPQAQEFRLSDTMMKQIRLDTAVSQPVRSELTLVGKVIADENKVIELFPLVGGNVESVSVELGDYVRKGQTLAVIRSGEVADLERQRSQAQSDLLVAQKNRQVAQELSESKLNSQREVVQAQKEVDQAQAEMNRINEVFRIYGISKSANYAVKAPIDGFVIDKKINPGTQLRSDNSASLFTVGQLSDVWVLANVNESDIGRIQTGMDAYIQTLSYPKEVFHGKVDKIYNVLDAHTKTMSVRIRLPNRDFKLKPQMHATIILRTESRQRLPAVTTDAIIFDRSKNFVVVFRNQNDVKIREVVVHKALRNTTYIQSGLQPGETVISKNQILLYNALTD